MKEEEANWFSRWEEELPSPEELTPLTESLITPDLALAFDIPGYSAHPKPFLAPPEHTPEFEPPDLAGAAGDDQPRTLKRPRLVWTPQLHKRFVDAVAHLGIKNAVPKTIMQLMSVDGLTRENVASHLQKYRLYLKRMQGMSSAAAHHDPATEQLFATGPLPHHFLPPRPVLDPFSAPAALHHQYYQPRILAPLSSPPTFRQQHRLLSHPHLSAPFPEDFDPARHAAAADRKVLTLFPTND